MKRSFLNALAACFAIGFVAGIFIILSGNQLAGILIALTSMSVTALLLRAADKAPVVTSTFRNFVGWIIGLCIGLTVVVAVMLL